MVRIVGPPLVRTALRSWLGDPEVVTEDERGVPVATFADRSIAIRFGRNGG
jgi:hypothetical protein